MNEDIADLVRGDKSSGRRKKIRGGQRAGLDPESTQRKERFFCILSTDKTQM